MSQTDLKYDQLLSTQPTKINSYILDNSSIQNNNTNFVMSTIGLNNKVYSDRNTIDNESDLFGLNKQLNKYPIIQDELQSTTNVNIPNNNIIDIDILGKNTRTSKSCNDMNFDTLDFSDVLLNDPQNLNHIIFNESLRGGLNSRIV